MDKITMKGKTVEEAIQLALDELSITKDEAEIEVISEGRNGLLGIIGKKEAEVVVTLRKAEEYYLDVVKQIINKMGFDVNIEVEEKNSDLVIRLESDETGGLLIGKNGRTLNALQHIIKRIGAKNNNRHTRITIDVGDYRKRHDSRLKDRAMKMAEKVKKEGREVVSPPLEAIDRRIIHRALRNDSEIKTYSIGDGIFRNVVVAPANSKRRDGQKRHTPRQPREFEE